MIDRLILSVCLLIVLVGASSVASAEDRPVPKSAKYMRAYMTQIAKIGDAGIEAMVRRDLPKFRFVRSPAETYEPIFGANRTIELIARNVDGAVGSVHDVDSGEILFGCDLPCSVDINGQSDYVIVMRKLGHLPDIRVIDPTYPVGEPFAQFMSDNMIEHGERIGQCWSDHETAGFPDLAEPTVCARLPPVMPAEADRSGHCTIQFDVLETGWVANERTVSCTQPLFAKASLSAIKMWYYVPKTQRGQTLRTTDFETKITFRLTDEFGVLIDESGVLKPK